MEIKTKKHFNEIIKSLTEEILDEEDLDETTGTGDVAGYNTPFAFKGKGKKGKKKNTTVKDSHVVQTMRYLELLKELKKSGKSKQKVI